MKPRDKAAIKAAFNELPIDTITYLFSLCQARISIRDKRLSYNSKFKVAGQYQDVGISSALDRVPGLNLRSSIFPALQVPRVVPRVYANLPWLLMQNWEEAFPSEKFDPRANYYVYQHCKDSTQQAQCLDYFSETSMYRGISLYPFYVGKGKGQRAYQFKGRCILHTKLLNRSLKVHHGNKDKIVNIVASGLTEAEAYQLESKLIYFFRPYFVDGMLTNVNMPTVPEMIRSFRFSKKNIITEEFDHLLQMSKDLRKL